MIQVTAFFVFDEALDPLTLRMPAVPRAGEMLHFSAGMILYRGGGESEDLLLIVQAVEWSIRRDGTVKASVHLERPVYSPYPIS